MYICINITITITIIFLELIDVYRAVRERRREAMHHDICTLVVCTCDSARTLFYICVLHVEGRTCTNFTHEARMFNKI